MKTITFRLADFTPRACTAEHNGTRYVVQRRADAQRWHVYADGLPLCSDTHTIEAAFAAVESHAAAKAAGGAR